MGTPALRPSGELGREPGLARTAGSDHGDQAFLGEDLAEAAEFGFPPDEARERGAQVAAGLLRRGGENRRAQVRVLAQEREVDLGEFGARVDAELVRECRTDAFVRHQRVGLPTRRVQRPHQLALETFAERMGGGEAFEHRKDLGLPAAGEVGLEPVLGGGQSEPVETDTGRLGERRVGGVGQGRTSPERLRLVEYGRRLLGPTGRERRPAVGGEPLEPVHVHLVRVDEQPVTRRMGLDLDRTVRRQRPSQPRHERLQCVHRPARRLVTPEPVDQRLDRDHRVGLEGQPDQECAQPRSADLDGPALLVPQLERTQNAHTHGPKPSR